MRRFITYAAPVIWIAAIVALVTLGSPFGGAEAAAVDIDDGLVIEVSVEVRGAFEAVLIRPFSSFDELPPTALVDQGDGTWAAFVEFPTAENWSVVFEALTNAGEAERSETVTLLELGVDPVVVGEEPAVPVRTPIDASTWWLVAGVVLALGALGILAWWTFSGERADSEEQ